jgi:hypothetical protein
LLRPLTNGHVSPFISFPLDKTYDVRSTKGEWNEMKGDQITAFWGEAFLQISTSEMSGLVKFTSAIWVQDFIFSGFVISNEKVSCFLKILEKGGFQCNLNFSNMSIYPQKELRDQTSPTTHLMDFLTSTKQQKSGKQTVTNASCSESHMLGKQQITATAYLTDRNKESCEIRQVPLHTRWTPWQDTNSRRVRNKLWRMLLVPKVVRLNNFQAKCSFRISYRNPAFLKFIDDFNIPLTFCTLFSAVSHIVKIGLQNFNIPLSYRHFNYWRAKNPKEIRLPKISK